MNRQGECALQNQFEELKPDSFRELQIYIGKKNHCMPYTYSKEVRVMNAARSGPDEKTRQNNENTQLNLGHGLPTNINWQ